MAERGSVHLLLASLLFGGMLMLGLAVDVTRLGTTWREAMHLAATAAEAGAGWIDPATARQDRIVIDAAAAAVAAQDVAAGGGRVVAVSATTDRVCVSVTIEVRPTLLGAVGAAPTEVTARACAEPRRG